MELGAVAPDEIQRLIFTAVEQAATGTGRRPEERPELLRGAAQQRQAIHEARRHRPREVEPDGNMTTEEGGEEGGKHTEPRSDEAARQAFPGGPPSTRRPATEAPAPPGQK